MKLIFKYNWCVPYEASGTEIFIIECDSKIDIKSLLPRDENYNRDKRDSKFINILHTIEDVMMKL